MDHTGLTVDRSLAADSGRHTQAAAGRNFADRTAGRSLGTVGAVLAVGKANGCGWRRGPGRTGLEGRHSRVAGERAAHAPLVGTGFTRLLARAHCKSSSHGWRTRTHLLLWVGAQSLAVLVLGLAVRWRRRVLLLLVVAAVALLLLLLMMRTIVAVALATIVVVIRHVGCVSRDE